MADKLADGQLAERLTTLRADGLSLDRIAARLVEEFGVQVTKQTVANWLAALGVEAVAR